MKLSNRKLAQLQTSATERRAITDEMKFHDPKSAEYKRLEKRIKQLDGAITTNHH